MDLCDLNLILKFRSSAPHPQNLLENPLTFSNCLAPMAVTPPMYLLLTKCPFRHISPFSPTHCFGPLPFRKVAGLVPACICTNSDHPPAPSRRRGKCNNPSNFPPPPPFHWPLGHKNGD
jgi:hypothetical protein